MRGTSRSPTCARWRPQLRTDHPGIEFNIEGDPRPDLLALVHEVRPDQCTLVPVREGEVTSQAGWPSSTPAAQLQTIIRDLQRDGVRVSVFIDPDLEAVRWAASLDADRIELYTEPFARAYAAGGDVRKKSFDAYVAAATLAHSLGLGINAGHDLDLDNLTLFRTLPYLDEVSIGHALISHALYVGLDRAVRDYLAFWPASSIPANPALAVTKPLPRSTPRSQRTTWLCVLSALGGYSS